MIHINGDTKGGEIYVGEDGSIHILESFFTVPSGTIVDVVTKQRQTGGSGCLNFQPYTRLDQCSPEQMRKAIEKMSELKDKGVVTMDFCFPKEVEEEHF